MKSAIFFFILAAAFIFISTIAFSQPPGLPATPNQAPIDGGLSLLAAAGGYYAYKKLKNKE